jgi:hypothetical protein|eukprot:COSAG01_NODE_4429_length_5032_cov_5.648490_3_plen_122_part_00
MFKCMHAARQRTGLRRLRICCQALLGTSTCLSAPFVSDRTTRLSHILHSIARTVCLEPQPMHGCCCDELVLHTAGPPDQPSAVPMSGRGSDSVGGSVEAVRAAAVGPGWSTVPADDRIQMT